MPYRTAMRTGNLANNIEKIKLVFTGHKEKTPAEHLAESIFLMAAESER